jgi:hypothetical protein
MTLGLLRQPHSLEGFPNLGLPEPQDLHARHPSVLEPDRHEDAILDPCTAPWHPPRDTPETDDLVPPLVEPVELPACLRQDLPLGPEHVLETAQRGYYFVYLFRRDGEGV